MSLCAASSGRCRGRLVARPHQHVAPDLVAPGIARVGRERPVDLRQRQVELPPSSRRSGPAGGWRWRGRDRSPRPRARRARPAAMASSGNSVQPLMACRTGPGPAPPGPAHSRVLGHRLGQDPAGLPIARPGPLAHQLAAAQDEIVDLEAVRRLRGDPLLLELVEPHRHGTGELPRDVVLDPEDVGRAPRRSAPTSAMRPGRGLDQLRRDAHPRRRRVAPCRGRGSARPARARSLADRPHRGRRRRATRRDRSRRARRTWRACRRCPRSGRR